MSFIINCFTTIIAMSVGVGVLTYTVSVVALHCYDEFKNRRK